jgi:hypothetical protein
LEPVPAKWVACWDEVPKKKKKIRRRFKKLFHVEQFFWRGLAGAAGCAWAAFRLLQAEKREKRCP